MDAKSLLIAAMVTLTVVFLIRWFVVARTRRAAAVHGTHEPVQPTALHLVVGAVTNFFDTLGIGSYATSTAMFRAWRLVPGTVGRWNSLDQRFARWQEKGVWATLLDHLAADADREWVMLDSTVVRAHACAAGAKKPKASKRLAARAAASPPSCTLPATPSATRWPSA